MPVKQSQPAEVISFVGGLITEASILNFPPNATTDETNFVLNRDGTRDRRLGMDFEKDFELVDTELSVSILNSKSINNFRWEAVSDDANLEMMVVQIGNVLRFHDASNASLSSALLGSVTLEGASEIVNYSFASVDGILVIATGGQSVHIVIFDNGVFTATTSSLLIRDTFGVADFDGSVDLTQGVNLAKRPTDLTPEHVYNLRNQTWGVSRPNGEGSSSDPITAFRNEASPTVSPSNADVIHASVYVDPEDDQNREKFFPSNAINIEPYNNRAPLGFFVIDALLRGASRVEEYEQNRINRSLDTPLSILPVDFTPGGATIVTEYAGRIWYAGFSGEVVDGDSKSPKLSSYVMFSRLVNNTSDITQCYQDGDPTSEESPDIVATDGGFIRISGAKQILGLFSIGAGLFVIASNGVWQLQGAGGGGFSADSFESNKLSDIGAISTESIVEVNDSIFYWADDGIYNIGPNDFGDFVPRNLTQGTVQTFYDNIDTLSKENSIGIYDSASNRVRWLIRTGDVASSNYEVRELILDINLSAFYPSDIKRIGDVSPSLISPVETSAFNVGISEDDIVVNGVLVLADGEQVILSSSVRGAGTRSVKYLTMWDDNTGTIKYTFSLFKDPDFLDWKSADDVGIDADAFMLTGFSNFQDNQRVKQVPYMTFHMRRTEDGFQTIEGETVPLKQSSCLIQTRWDWTNSTRSGRFSSAFQAYRYRRHYFPEDVFDSYDTGFATVISKNKLRGRGKSLALFIKTEPGKDCRILGWSLMINGNPNV